MILDLNNTFPQAEDGTRGPLPKQLEFLQRAMDPKGPKHIRYSGGVGSGKTLIGCITVLSWAVTYPGDYLIARLFMPELRITTMKTFLEICPPELIHEYRVADAIVKLKCAGGGYSTIMFRGLEEPDKLRSLNLNGCYIDEAVQVSEEAFMLLQSRIRGKHVRKIILTSNSAGHSWAWRYFVDKSMFKSETIKDQFYNIKAPSTENRHLPEGYVQGMLDTWSDDRIKREILADEDSFEGQVYAEFKRELHVVKPFKIPDHWEKHIRVDHGYRNPASIHFYAVNREGEVYVYKEFYEREWLINEIIKGKSVNGSYQAGIEALGGVGDNKTKFITAKIDPSTKNRSGTDGTSDFDEYYRHWPKHWPYLGFARNDVRVGIERVKSYLKPHPKTGKPLLYIFDTCINMLEEISNYKYPELKSGQSDLKAEHEKPIKAHDHAMDELRYMIVDLPDPAAPADPKEKTRIGTLERSLANEIIKWKKPPSKNYFGKGDV